MNQSLTFKSVLIVLLVMICSTLKAETVDYTIDGFTYSLNKKTEEAVLSRYRGSAIKVVVPEEIIYEEKIYRVMSIGDGCFSNCTFLTSIEIPSSVISIGRHCVSNCSSLISIVVDTENPSYDSREGCNAIITKRSNIMIAGCNNTFIPSSVTSLEENCFYGCSSLMAIEIPSSVWKLGGNCFFGCSSLTAIEIPSSVSSIGWNCFYDCTSLSSIVVDPSNPFYDSREECNAIITKMSGTMIVGCKNTFIPSSVTSLGSYCFFNCDSLTSIEIPSSVTSIGDGCFGGCSSLTAIEIPSSVTSIGDGCFEACYSLTSIEIPSSVTSLGNCCFMGCWSLTSIEIPSSVTSLGDCCFMGCWSLTSIEIPSSVTSLGDCCFSYCSSLTSIEIPSSVTSIGDGCFMACSSLTAIVVDPNNFYYDSREKCNAIIETESNTMIVGCKNTFIPSSVTSLGKWCFSGCDSLMAIEIPSSVTSIGNQCFLCCYSLTAIEIPSSVTSIEDGCFGSCSSLTSIEIPSSVTTLGDECFDNCSSLKTVICKMEEVKSGNYFTITTIEEAILYVPEHLLDTYKNTSPWSNFGTILPLTEMEINDIQESVISFQSDNGNVVMSGLADDTPVSYYSAEGRLLGKIMVDGGTASFSAKPNILVIVKADKQSFKVGVK